MIKIIRFMLVMMVIGLMTGCTYFPRFYLGADEIHGKVVDADTKEPIKDVVVVAVWKQDGGIIEEQHTANLVLRETTSDEQGNYVIDGWGPRLTFSGYIDNSAPSLIFYKYGYAPNRMGNITWGPNAGTYVHSEWTGKTIELKKFVGTPKNYAESLSSLGDFLQYDSWYSGCDWKRVPQYTAAMIKLNIDLGQDRGWGPSNFTLDRLKSSGSRCGFNPGEVEKFLGKYLNEK